MVTVRDKAPTVFASFILFLRDLALRCRVSEQYIDIGSLGSAGLISDSGDDKLKRATLRMHPPADREVRTPVFVFVHAAG